MYRPVIESAQSRRRVSTGSAQSQHRSSIESLMAGDGTLENVPFFVDTPFTLAWSAQPVFYMCFTCVFQAGRLWLNE